MKKIVKYGLIVVVAIVVCVAFYFLFPETVFKLAIDAQRRSADLVKNASWSTITGSFTWKEEQGKPSCSFMDSAATRTNGPPSPGT